MWFLIVFRHVGNDISAAPHKLCSATPGSMNVYCAVNNIESHDEFTCRDLY